MRKMNARMAAGMASGMLSGSGVYHLLFPFLGIFAFLLIFCSFVESGRRVLILRFGPGRRLLLHRHWLSWTRHIVPREVSCRRHISGRREASRLTGHIAHRRLPRLIRFPFKWWWRWRGRLSIAGYGSRSRFPVGPFLCFFPLLFLLHFVVVVFQQNQLKMRSTLNLNNAFLKSKCIILT